MVGPWNDPTYQQTWRPRDYYPSQNEVTTSIDPFGRSLTQVGFTIIDPITPYRQVTRTINYGILFIVLTFGAFLCIELMTGVLFHYVQYFVVGTSLVLFFLTLLSLSEHIGFGYAYIIASLLITCMLVTYTHFAGKTPQITTAVLALLVLLYGVLYLILQLVDYALLVGTALMLLLLGVLMWATKNLTAHDQATN